MANLGVAVADGDDFARAIVIGDLVDIAVFFGFLEDAETFFFGDVVGLFGLDAVIGHIADGEAPIFRVAGTTYAKKLFAHRAGARRSGQVAIIFIKPIGNVFDIDGSRGVLDGFLDGDDVHANASATWRNHLG